MGAEVREIRRPLFGDYATCCRIIIRCEAYAIHRRCRSGLATMVRSVAGACSMALM